jgi:molybdate/tungstate transport system ATP-binding protein
MPKSIEVDGIRKSYGEGDDAVHVLDGIDFTIDEREFVCILGPSGCGKTTLLSVVAGLLSADDGRVELDGADLTDRPPEQRNAAYVFQDGALFPHMSVRENVAYAAASDTAVTELAATFEIADLLDRPVSTLSGGERQRVAFARALAADPDALLLDEPLANLDAPIKRRLRVELRDVLAELDIPVVYVTHDQRQATTMGDRIAVMRDGAVQQVGPAEEIFQRPASGFVAEFTGSTNLFEAAVRERREDALDLAWGETSIEAPAYDVESDRVAFCIRPEYVMILREDRPVGDRANVLEGHIARRIYQGDGYVVVFEPAVADDSIEIRLPASVYERLGLGEREAIRVSLKKRAIHVIDGDGTGGS